MDNDACCKHCEESLPAYIDGELNDGGAADVHRHLERCAACRAALEALEGLDRALNRLPRYVPDGPAVSRAVMARLGLRRQSRAAILIRRLPLNMLAPPFGIAATLFVARNLLVRLLERLVAGSVVLAERWIDAIDRLLAAAGSESAALVFAALTGALLIVFAAASIITLRIARR